MKNWNLQSPVFDAPMSGLPTWAWYWMPILFVVFLPITRLFGEGVFTWYVMSETGFAELFTAGLFLLAGIFAFRVARNLRGTDAQWISPLLYVYAAVGIFVALEEISYGQHFFGWGTPEWVGELNKQNETNLHNMAERVLDQKPRAIAAIVLLIFGALVPWLMSKGWIPALNKLVERIGAIKWLMPTVHMIPAALLVFAIRLPDRLQVVLETTLPFPFDIPTRHYQESQETLIAICVFLFAWELMRRTAAYKK